MPLHLWGSKVRALTPHLNVVVLGATPDQRATIVNCLGDFEISILESIPATGNFLLAVAGRRHAPAALPGHVPLVDLLGPSLEIHLRAAALYVLAQDEITK